MSVIWKSFRVSPDEGDWEPANYNIQTEDGQEYGRWRRVLRKHRHGLTVISRYKAPPGKAWKIIGKASELGEEVYIMEGAYYDARGRILAGPGTFMFNAPGARHAASRATSPYTFTAAAANPTKSFPLSSSTLRRRKRSPNLASAPRYLRRPETRGKADQTYNGRCGHHRRAV